MHVFLYVFDFIDTLLCENCDRTEFHMIQNFLLEQMVPVYRIPLYITINNFTFQSHNNMHILEDLGLVIFFGSFLNHKTGKTHDYDLGHFMANNFIITQYAFYITY